MAENRVSIGLRSCNGDEDVCVSIPVFHTQRCALAGQPLGGRVEQGNRNMTHTKSKVESQGDRSKIRARKGQSRTRHQVLGVGHGAHHGRKGRQEQSRSCCPSAQQVNYESVPFSWLPHPIRLGRNREEMVKQKTRYVGGGGRGERKGRACALQVTLTSHRAEGLVRSACHARSTAYAGREDAGREDQACFPFWTNRARWDDPVHVCHGGVPFLEGVACSLELTTGVSRYGE